MEYLIKHLKEKLKSEVRSDTISKQLYSTDASIYSIEPVAIVLPRTKSDLVHTLEIASLYHTPVIARGAATGVVGGCIGKGLVIDCSKYLNRITEINYKERYAVVQPGCVLDHLNEAIAPHGLCIGPDTSTSNRATLGGMVATNATGATSLLFGTMRDHVIEVEMVLWNGEVVRFHKLTKEEWKEKLKLKGQEGKIYRTLERIKKEYGHDIKEHFPKIERRSSGYSLDLLLHHECNVAKLICGSEGTLGVISEIKLELSPRIEKQMCVVGTKNLLQTLKEAADYLHLAPSTFELIDKKVITAGLSSPLLANRLDWLQNWLQELPEAILIIECPEVSKFIKLAKEQSNTLFAKAIEDPLIQKSVLDLRKAGLGLLLSKRGYSQAVGFIEDVAVPIEHIASFIEKVVAELARCGKEAGIYGHLGAGCLHIRPYFDTRKPEELLLMQQLLEKVCDLVVEYRGVLSSEHGDGLARSQTTKRVFGDRLYNAFCLFKHGFDPYDKMNPGKIVGDTQKLTENLRLSPEMKTEELPTYFDFSREGGFALAVDMCNGNGACRKKEGVMCPSFQVTQDERDSTRARAHVLQGLIHGQISDTNQNFDEVMDLCIQCKGCKKECPSQVDMAKMKSEYLYQRKKHRLRDKLFAHLPTLFRIGSLFPWLANLSLIHKLLHFIGIQGSLPKLAKKRFSRPIKTVNSEKKVVLFIDTFTEFLTPEIGLKAVELLEAIGFSVITPPWKCCGRTLISKGLLPEAKEKINQLVDQLYPFAKEGLPIIGLEPSCLLTLVDEARAFRLDTEKVEVVSNASCLIDEFLLDHIETLSNILSPFPGNVHVHTHCHQKALSKPVTELTLLKRLVTGTVQEIPSGCCGMAGSFGYEQEHAHFSHKIGQLVLFPYIRAHEGVIISSGTSCRSHIAVSTEKKALHLVDFLYSQKINNKS